ncbi:unnamed protein product [Lasius platythorax]|uniref:Uncharacterized protein n=1 Tax=Lasius platythorax TaxID=488582 RepID=A0AAV2MY55_9HYME
MDALALVRRCEAERPPAQPTRFDQVQSDQRKAADVGHKTQTGTRTGGRSITKSRTPTASTAHRSTCGASSFRKERMK